MARRRSVSAHCHRARREGVARNARNETLERREEPTDEGRDDDGRARTGRNDRRRRGGAVRLNEETPKGARVVVLLDNGQEDITRTRSKPWWLITARRRR